VFGDGMEHRDSTSISDTVDLKDSGPHAIDTVSHEFFHAWNVRRIRPRSLEPFDFERANMSGELWFAEGFTSYYGPLMMKRAGISTLDDLAKDLSGAVNRVLNAPGRELFSVVDMSRQAAFVDAARSIDATNFRNTFISYYTYGAALAFGLDLAIRERFAGKSLDDWMKAMWRLHPEINRPYALKDLEEGLSEATGDGEFCAVCLRAPYLRTGTLGLPGTGGGGRSEAAESARRQAVDRKRSGGGVWGGPEIE
jgi:predicted metalloprotease with PDZ domain